jgi:hypothetical protein
LIFSRVKIWNFSDCGIFQISMNFLVFLAQKVSIITLIECNNKIGNRGQKIFACAIKDKTRLLFYVPIIILQDGIKNDKFGPE